MGQSIPFACQDCANAKGAYRFLSNDRVNEADILAGHFQSTRDRAGAAEGLIFMLHDTTEFTRGNHSNSHGTTFRGQAFAPAIVLTGQRRTRPTKAGSSSRCVRAPTTERPSFGRGRCYASCYASN
jgi:hypothetical protein